MPSPEPSPSPADPPVSAVDLPASPVHPSGSPVEPARRRGLLLTLVLLTAGVLLVDQLTKAWALSALEEGTRTSILGDLLGLQLIRNSGAALGIANGTTWVLTLVASVVVVVVVRAARRLGSLGWAVALGLLLGGALGNLVDRFLRQPGFARGHVVDFLAYGDWFIGNVADIAIVAAAGLVMILALRGVRLDGTREVDDPLEADADPDGPGREGAAPEAPEATVDEVPGSAPATDEHATGGRAVDEQPTRSEEPHV